MSSLTPLENAVMQAMVWQMREGVPDLADQLDDISPARRRNTGAGLFVQLAADANRNFANPDATGLFGTVHVMIANLPDPVGFKIELRQGRLLALHGQSYGQDTRALNFSSVPFGDVFTVDANGRSVLFRPAPRHEETFTPPVRRQAPTPVAMAPVTAAPPRPAPVQDIPDNPQEAPLVKMLEALSDPVATPQGRLALTYIGAYVLAAVFVLFVTFATDTTFIFPLAIAIFALRSIHGPKGRVRMAELSEKLNDQGLFNALKSG